MPKIAWKVGGCDRLNYISTAPIRFIHWSPNPYVTILGNKTFREAIAVK